MAAILFDPQDDFMRNVTAQRASIEGLAFPM